MLKMVIGAIVIALSYLAIAALTFWAQHQGKQVSWGWLATFMVVMTAGELYILPVGLGLFGRLAPSGFTATSIAGWYFAGFLGNIFAGWLGTLWTPLSHGVFFALIGSVALIAAGLLSLSIRNVTRAERRPG